MGTQAINLSDPLLVNASQPFQPAETNDHLILKIFEATLYGLVALISIVGNSFLILAYKRNITGQMRSVYNLLVASIGASDLLLAIWSIPERMTRVLMDDAWLVEGVLGIILCKVVNFAEKVSITVSFLHLGALAFDRFLVVFYPCRSMVSIRSSKITIAIIWGMSIVYWSPILYFGGLRMKKDALSCGVRKFTPNWEYWYLPFIIVLFGTLFVILMLYVLVALKLWLRKLPGHQTYSINKRVDRSKRRMAKMVSLIVFAFYFCFLPYGIGWVGCSYMKAKPKEICNPLYKFINILILHLNCAVNPIICLAFNNQYRLEWKLALRDPFGLRVNASRMSYRKRKSSTTTEAMMTIGNSNCLNKPFQSDCRV